MVRGSISSAHRLSVGSTKQSEIAAVTLLCVLACNMAGVIRKLLVDCGLDWAALERRLGRARFRLAKVRPENRVDADSC